jgi:hypothetical protein
VPSNAANSAPESKRGQHSQSIESKSLALAIANKSVVFDALCHGSVSVMIKLNTWKDLPFS